MAEYPPTLSYNTILGRVSPGVGPAEEIPIVQLLFLNTNPTVISSTAEALAGTRNDRLMTPLSTRQAIDDRTRELLTADRTFFIRTDGSDANDGSANDAAHAFATLQGAYDKVVDFYDFGSSRVTLQLQNTTWGRPGGALNILFITKPWVGGKGPGGVGGIGGGALAIIGDEITPTNCILDIASTGAVLSKKAIFVNCGLPGVLDLSGVQIKDSIGGGVGIFNNASGANINIGKVNFGSVGATGIHMWAAQGSTIFNFTSNYTISGGANYHVFAEVGGVVDLEISTITLTGTPAFAESFAHVESGAKFYSAVTYSGAATGKRFHVKNGGAIRVLDTAFVDPGNAALTNLPGNATGDLLGGGSLNAFTGTSLSIVSSLPAPGSIPAGGRGMVVDATVTTFATIVAGGGANTVPVYCDGTNWRIG